MVENLTIYSEELESGKVYKDCIIVAGDEPFRFHDMQFHSCQFQADYCNRSEMIAFKAA